MEFFSRLRNQDSPLPTSSVAEIEKTGTWEGLYNLYRYTHKCPSQLAVEPTVWYHLDISIFLLKVLAMPGDIDMMICLFQVFQIWATHRKSNWIALYFMEIHVELIFSSTQKKSLKSPDMEVCNPPRMGLKPPKKKNWFSRKWISRSTVLWSFVHESGKNCF